MTVYRKKLKNGKLSKYYYNFKFNGERYNATTQKSTKPEALRVEKELKEELERRYNRCLLDDARDIKVATAINNALDKPSDKKLSVKHEKRKKQIWQDFTDWCQAHFPKVILLNQVTRPIAEAYINYLRKYGKFNKVIKSKNKSDYVTNFQLSTKTINDYQKQVKWVFEQLIADAGLDRNPFAHIKQLKSKVVKREAYTNEEITLIEGNIEDYPFCQHLYYVGTGTGMRMGNICLLGWEDIDMDKKLICCENLKTGGKLTIPILPDLYKYLLSCEPKANGFVSAEHAKVYMKANNLVSSKFIKFLNIIGIETQTYVEGRSRATNIKGIHAIRHTFIYRAMLANIPLNVIQCIVGHVDDDITKMYADHVMAQDAQVAMVGFSIKEADGKKKQMVSDIIKRLPALADDKLKEVLKLVS